MKKIIESFINDKYIGLIGASRNPKKWGNIMQKELTKKDYKVAPVNPNTDVINGVNSFKTVNDLPSEVKNIIIALPANIINENINNITNSNIKRIWVSTRIKEKSTLDNIIKSTNDKGFEIIHGYCPMMFLTPSGVHNFHKTILKLFGKLPA